MIQLYDTIGQSLPNSNLSQKKVTPGPKAFVHWSLTFLQHGFVTACLGTKAKCYRSWLKHPFNVEIVDIPIQIAALYFCSSRVWCFWYLYWVILWQWWIEETTRLILTLVSFHEVVDEDTEMFWMFLRVSHIANCLRSMFHRIWHIWILMVFLVSSASHHQTPSPSNTRTFWLSNSLIHTFTVSLPLVAQQADANSTTSVTQQPVWWKSTMCNEVWNFELTPSRALESDPL